MAQLLIKYPLDLTGKNPNNLVTNEKHELKVNARGDLRVLVPDHGSFYAQSIKLYDANGQTLDRNTDYVATFLYQDASERTGLEVCGAIVIKDPSISNTIYLDYQVVGGDYAVSVDTLQQVIDTLSQDNRPVTWANIVGKPNEYPPGEHPHALWQLYGFEPVVEALERIMRAIIASDQATLDEIRRYAKRLFDDAIDRIDDLRDDFNTHLNDFGNPHDVTKAQVGLGLVYNYTKATRQEAEQGQTDERYMTPRRTADAILYQVVPMIQRHIDDKSNPHNVTKAQTGLGNVPNYPIANRTQAQEGTGDAFMTPLRTKEAITYQVMPIIQRHLDDKSNPHDVTKAQTGLGNVDNYPTATRSQAESGGTNSAFMTPLRTAEAINYQVRPMIQRHINDKSNPHNVTKAQTGLGSVPNYPAATNDDVHSRRNDRLVTPAVLGSAIDYHILTGGHDDRYVMRNGNLNGDIHIANGRAYVRIDGNWRQFWPAQWA